MAYRFQCKKCKADIDFMTGMEAGKTGKIKDHNCGCLPCTAYISWEDRLCKSHLKLYRLLKHEYYKQQKTITEF